MLELQASHIAGPTSRAFAPAPGRSELLWAMKMPNTSLLQGSMRRGRLRLFLTFIFLQGERDDQIHILISLGLVPECV